MKDNFTRFLGRKKTSSGKHRFNLKSTNSQVIGTSESYEPLMSAFGTKQTFSINLISVSF